MEIIKKIQQKSLYAWILGIVAVQLVFPSGSAIAPAKAAENDSQDTQLIQLIAPIHASAAETKTEKQEYEVKKTYTITITAYSSTVDQTDDTPCITANGFNLCENNEENVIAANFLPFGTKVKIPEYFGDRIFTVQDRMNARYYYRADVWFKTRQDAIKFGAPYTEIQVVEEI
ncbi:MAG: 3D domain-containing protein [Candidatus Buchananbacteria bacterium]|nr:3D domain-containing protein [Candidatus Buchananbacteria bacterium]